MPADTPWFESSAEAATLQTFRTKRMSLEFFPPHAHFHQFDPSPIFRVFSPFHG
jgi:hypothetical protein